MSEFLNKVLDLIHSETVRISEHGYNELSDDDLTVAELLSGVDEAEIVEKYPDYPKGSCISLLQKVKKKIPFMYYGEYQKVIINR